MSLESFSFDQVQEWATSVVGLDERQAHCLAETQGRQLLKMSVDDLKSLGLSGLQAKKVYLKVQEERATSGVSSDVAVEVTLQGKTTHISSSATTAKQSPNLLTAAPPTMNRERIAFQNDALGYQTTIEGFETQLVSIELGPGMTIQAEPGAMVYMDDGINYETKTDGKGWRRLVTGQRLFLTEYWYRGPEKGTVAFSATFPGRIIPLKLEDHGGSIVAQKGSFLCGAKEIQTYVAFAQSWGAGFFGGTGFILQKFQGPGYVFLNAGGVAKEMQLRAGQSIRVSTGSLVAFEESCQYKVEMIDGGIFDAIFGREGLFLTTLWGPGKVWIASLPSDRFAKAMYQRMPKCPSQIEADKERMKGKAILGGIGLAAGLMDTDRDFRNGYGR